MCGKKELFSQLDESLSGKFNFGNKSKILIMGKSNVKIYSKDGNDVTIANVFFILDFFLEFVKHGIINK